MKRIFKLLLAFTLVFVFSFYCVKAQETEGEEPEVVVVEPITTAPVVKLKGNNNSLIITWGVVEHATSYKIERSTDAKKGYKTIAKNVVDTTYTDKKLAYGTKYYYKVTALNSKGQKTSAVVSKKVAPNKITNVVLKQSGSTKIVATWDQTKNSGYYIFRSTDGKKWTKVKTISKNSTVSFTDSKLKSNKNYYYQIQAFQKVGKKIYTGSKSDALKIKTAPAAPALKFYTDDIETIRIRVAEVSGVTTYRFYSYNEETKKWEQNWTIYPEWFQKGYYYDYEYVEKPYHTYKYKVKACRNDVCGSYTEISGQAKLSKVQIYGLRGEKKAAHLYIEYSWDSDGVEIWRATSKNGNYKKIKTIKSGYERYYKDASLSSGKTYYYKVRAYATIDGKKQYSSYSSIRSIKTGSDAAVTTALEDAKRLNKEWYFSKIGLINELVDYYGYKKADATKGVEKGKFDYKANALNLAKHFIKYAYALTKEGLRYSLINEYKFTAKEADYALSKVNFDAHQLLVDAIEEEYLYGNGFGRAYYISTYTTPAVGYSEEEVAEIVDNLNIDYNVEAVKRINYFLSFHDTEYMCTTVSEVTRILEESGFTEEEIEYAFENADEYNFNQCIINDYNYLVNYEGNPSYYSKAEVIDILASDFYGYTAAEVEAALEAYNVNFNEVALGRANKLLSSLFFSRQLLENSLISYGFTEEEVEYALNNVTADYAQNAYTILSAAIEQEPSSKNRAGLSSYLSGLGFTDDEITYALNQIPTDKWIYLAEKSIIDYLDYYNNEQNSGISESGLVTIMVEQYHFTNAEVNAALENLSIDFAEQALISARRFVAEGTYSKESLINLLTNSGYTSEDATTAANSETINYGEECAEYIRSHYIGVENPGSLDTIISDLAAYGFSESEINYAVEVTNLESYL